MIACVVDKNSDTLRSRIDKSFIVPSWIDKASIVSQILLPRAGVSTGEASRLLPLDSGDGALHNAADRASRDIYTLCDQMMNSQAIRLAIDDLCAQHGIAPPVGCSTAGAIRRGVD